MRFSAVFFQAADGIRDRSPSRGLGDVYKRQLVSVTETSLQLVRFQFFRDRNAYGTFPFDRPDTCLLYTSDAADEEDSVDYGDRRLMKKKKKKTSLRERKANTKKSDDQYKQIKKQKHSQQYTTHNKK